MEKRSKAAPRVTPRIPAEHARAGKNGVAGLVTSLLTEKTYVPTVEGTIPAGLSGWLYRNGPGLFERAGLRKRSMLDGDGMVQSFFFDRGQVTYANRFVRTRKFVEEEKAGTYLYPTWTTLSPTRWTRNLGLRFPSQAGVSVIRRGDQLFALDEFQVPHQLDPRTLETIGEAALDKVNAHYKVDATTGEWFLFHAFTNKVEISVRDRENRLTSRRKLKMPRMVYLHDWFVTKKYFIFILHPVSFRPGDLLKAALGKQTVCNALQFKPEQGNLIWLVPRDEKEPPFTVEARGSWVWHTLNAYDTPTGPVVDFVGWESFRDLGDPDSFFTRIMEGIVPPPEKPAGFIRRYRIDVGARHLQEQVLFADADYEFPAVNPLVACDVHHYGYFSRRRESEPYYTEIARVDYRSLTMSKFDFGEGVFCTEPVFVPRENSTDDAGWVMSVVYDSHRHRGYLAIFDAHAIERGPLAKVWLEHHVPLTTHGSWFPLGVKR